MERYILRANAGALAAVGASACNMECADDVEQLFFKAVCGSLIFDTRLGVIENALFAGTCGAYVTACVTADAARELTLPERIALIGGHCLKALDLVKAMRIKYLAVLAEQLVIYYMTAALAVFAALEQKLGARCCENIIIRCKMYGLAVLLCAEQLGNEMLHLALVKHSVAGDSDNVNIVADYSVLAQQLIEAVRVAGLKKDSGLSLAVAELYGVFRHISTAEAIDYKQQDEIIERQYGAIVVATGFEQIKPTKYDEYAYNQSKDVVTSLELERLMNAAGPNGGTLLRPSDKTHPHTIVFVQCVGSRCSDERGKPYCSKVCCMYTAKHAMLIREKYPDTEVYVFYIDVRTPGKNFDEFYRRAVEQYDVHYIKGMVGKVSPRADGTLDVQASDLILNKQLHISADMVVLASAVEPDKSARPLATMLTASMDTNDFFTEAHPKLRPVESPTAGIFLSGMCQGPKDIPETVAQASAAASKVIALLCKDKLTCNPCVAHSDEMMCNGCSSCEKVCPYGAITYVDKEFRMPNRTTAIRRVAQVNPAVCQGCGACTVACPSGAMDLSGFSNKQIMAEVDAICR